MPLPRIGMKGDPFMADTDPMPHPAMWAKPGWVMTIIQSLPSAASAAVYVSSSTAA